MSIQDRLLERINALGGDVAVANPRDALELLQATRLPLPLYPAPRNTPWASADEQEPIFGISEFIAAQPANAANDRAALLRDVQAHYYAATEELRGQVDFRLQRFTPFVEGSDDYVEWAGGDDLDTVYLEEITGHATPELLFIGFSEGYPNHHFMCVADADQLNPPVYSTDHEQYLSDISRCGTLQEWLASFMTPAELLQRVNDALDRDSPSPV
ncbi:hypothetical protein [Stenotrophomonas sp. SY1]|uniref:hypothetical protein n=1 Tax=Stenotrophomonas sp. SY1 TaxID=477235 RepID=UPI001E482484|nr:hypothetical protein [Stenotrophomonas sp. SY1]MCD9088168.1 hypothetical protein [Stenotrophomonas sp. SY1]